jgi:ABC-type uncharacterized transport system substrate-binding protein
LGSTTPSVGAHWLAAFVQRMRELNWIEGRTVAIEVRWAGGRSERFAEIAAELVRLKVDVIVTSGGAVAEAKQATSVIPIVFGLANDPVGAGLVTNLARPGGNVTGLSLQSSDLAGKRLELLREVVPALRRLAIMANIGNPSNIVEMGEVQAAASTLGIHAATSEIQRVEDIAPTFEALKGRADALYQPAHEHQSGSHQQLGAGRAIANHAHCPGARRSRGSDVLWTKLAGSVPARRRHRRHDSARDEARRYPGRATYQIRARP